MNKHLLIIEDEQLILFSLTAALKSGSIQISTAATGKNALSKIASSANYDLYLVDLSLPDMRGEELIQEIRKSQPQAKFIILTGRYHNKQAMLDSMERAIDLEPFHFISKPFEIEEVQEVVFQVLTGDRS